jgi:CRP-like cAMP-binding protein
MNNQLREVNKAELDTRLKLLCENIRVLNQSYQEIGNKDVLVRHLLHDQTRLEIECLFHLLALKYNARQIEKVRYNFFSSNMIQRANALELLDDILPRRIASGIGQLLDTFAEGMAADGPGLSEDTLKRLRTMDPWLKVVITYHLNNGTVDGVEQLSDHEKTMYVLLERVAFLKKVPLFKEVPGNYLLAVAKITQPVALNDGSILFQQGDRGDAMYLICRGSMSVQVHGMEVIRLGVGDCIGEMSILDNRPRSASCIAAEETELLKITAREFEIIMTSQTSVMFAVLRTLAERLRHQTRYGIGREATQRIQRNRSAKTFPQTPQPEPWPSVVPAYHQSRNTFATASERELYGLLERISFLKKVSLFQEIPEEHLVSLAKLMQPVTLQEEKTLFDQGDPGDAMYLICQGSISVQVHGVEVSRLEAGDCIGEMSLLDDMPRSASCIAAEKTDLLKITAQEVETLMKTTSVAFSVLRILTDRLRRQTANTIKSKRTST